MVVAADDPVDQEIQERSPVAGDHDGVDGQFVSRLESVALARQDNLIAEVVDLVPVAAYGVLPGGFVLLLQATGEPSDHPSGPVAGQPTIKQVGATETTAPDVEPDPLTELVLAHDDDISIVGWAQDEVEGCLAI